LVVGLGRGTGERVHVPLSVGMGHHRVDMAVARLVGVRRLDNRQVVLGQGRAAGFPYRCEVRIARPEMGVGAVLHRAFDLALGLRKSRSKIVDLFARFHVHFSAEIVREPALLRLMLLARIATRDRSFLQARHRRWPSSPMMVFSSVNLCPRLHSFWNLPKCQCSAPRTIRPGRDLPTNIDLSVLARPLACMSRMLSAWVPTKR